MSNGHILQKEIKRIEPTDEHMFQSWPMKPIMIIPPDAMSTEDIQILRDNHLCVVVAKDPSLIQFVDPIPSVSCRTEIESAAIQLSRKFLNHGYWANDDTRKTCAAMFVDLLVKGTPLDPKPSHAEQERQLFSEAKREEIARLAREEARAERATAKGAKMEKK